MKDRYLPFVTAKTPIAIIQKRLWEGGRGVSDNVLLSVLQIIKIKGIDYVRKSVSELSTSWETRYTILIGNNAEITEAISNLGSFLGAYNEYCTEEVFSSYISEEETGELHQFAQFVSNPMIPEGVFKDNVELRIFTSFQELCAYVFHWIFTEGTLAPVTAVYKESAND